GFLGEPIDPVYQDHELFADFLTAYYTDWEPESSFVLEIDGEIRGYLLGSRKPLRNQLYAFWQNVSLFLKAVSRYFHYNQKSRRFVLWILMYGWREVPAAPRRVPHFHINLLPDARKMSTTRALMSAYLSYLYRCGEKRVYGQIVTFESRRGEQMFERYGFKVLNRAALALPIGPIRAVHFAALVFSAGSACGLFFLALRFMNRFWAFVAAAVFILLSADPWIQGTAANTEIFMLLPVIFSQLMFF